MKETEVRGQLQPDEVDDFVRRLTALRFDLIRMGKMEDVVFDHPSLNLRQLGQKLRIRYYSDARQGELCWKGRKYFEDGQKIREEWQCETTGVLSLYKIVEKLGFVKQKVIERKIQVFQRFYNSYSITCRIEEFPKHPGLILAEIEGTREGINWFKSQFEFDGKKVFGPYTLNSFLKKYS